MSTFALVSCIAVIVVGGVIAACCVRPRTNREFDERDDR